MKPKCPSCHRLFIPYLHVPDQEFCSKPECQNYRRRLWLKNMLASDESYRANQADAQKAWAEKNKGYWKAYRENHPDYVERNRKQQLKRNLKQKQRKKERGDENKNIAKTNVSNTQTAILSGHYRLIPLEGPGIAKMNALIVKIDVISGGNS
jgi:hypothetical protein